MMWGGSWWSCSSLVSPYFLRTPADAANATTGIATARIRMSVQNMA